MMYPRSEILFPHRCVVPHDLIDEIADIEAHKAAVRPSETLCADARQPPPRLLAARTGPACIALQGRNLRRAVHCQCLKQVGLRTVVWDRPQQLFPGFVGFPKVCGMVEVDPEEEILVLVPVPL